MVAFALLAPLVLLPFAAYAVEVGNLSARQARLQQAAAQAAIDSAQQLDVAALRAGTAFRVDPAAASSAARSVLMQAEPSAVLDSVTVSGSAVSVRAHERVPLVFGRILPGGPVTLRAVAAARLTTGYDSPSSLLPFPISSL